MGGHNKPIDGRIHKWKDDKVSGSGWQINSTCQICGRPCNKGDNYGKDGCSECARENNEG